MKLSLVVLVQSFSLMSFASEKCFSPGQYVSTHTKYPIAIRINQQGFLRSAFPMTIPQGVKVAVSFPKPLSWNPETETFITEGWFSVPMVGPGVSVFCRYPVQLESTFLNGGYEADMSLVFSQRYFYKDGHCTQEGEAETFHMFRWVRN